MYSYCVYSIESSTNVICTAEANANCLCNMYMCVCFIYSLRLFYVYDMFVVTYIDIC